MFAFGGRPTRLRTGFGDTTRTKHGKVASLCRTRDAVQGALSGLKSDGAAVTIMMELMSCHSMLPKHPPLALYRSKAKVVTWRYSQATQPLRQMVTESGTRTSPRCTLSASEGPLRSQRVEPCRSE